MSPTSIDLVEKRRNEINNSQTKYHDLNYSIIFKQFPTIENSINSIVNGINECIKIGDYLVLSLTGDQNVKQITFSDIIEHTNIKSSQNRLYNHSTLYNIGINCYLYIKFYNTEFSYNISTKLDKFNNQCCFKIKETRNVNYFLKNK